MALTTNLSAYYKFDESSGNASDSSGNGYTLTNNGTTAYAAAKINNGADFGSTNTTKSFSIANDMGITGTSITMACWVNITTAPASGDSLRFMYHGDSGTKVNEMILYKNNSGTLEIYYNRLRAGIANDGFFYTKTLTTGTWYHVAMTYDGSTITGYLNGVSVGTSSSSGNGTDAGYYDGVKIGVNHAADADWMTGLIDEAGIWSRALTAEEVAQLYNSYGGIQYPFTNPTLVFNQTNESPTNQSAYTFSSVNLGTATSDRVIIVSTTGRADDGTARTLSSMTIGGVSATINVQSENSGNVAAIACASVPTGTTGDVVVTFSGTMGDAKIATYRATNISTTATDTGSSSANPLTDTLNISATGFALSMAKSDGTTPTATWTNLVERFDESDQGGNYVSGASQTYQTAQTALSITCTWTSSTRPILVMSSFNAPTTANSTNFLSFM